jgi:hypothetical protein
VEWFLGVNLMTLQGLEWAAPIWKIMLGIIAVIVAVWYLWRTRPEGDKRVLELVGWFGIALFLSVMNAEPMLISEIELPTDGRTVILVDASASMSVESEGKSRFDRAKSLVQKMQRDLDGSIDVWYLGDALTQNEPVGDAFCQQTDLLQGLQVLRDRYLGQELQGIILISDGID